MSAWCTIQRTPTMNVTRRDYLAMTGGALLAGSVLPALGADDKKHDKDDAEVLYGHGMVWNRDLPGILSELRLGFELRVNLETGAGFGTSNDPVHPEWNTHFAINSTEQEKAHGGETRFTMKGVVTQATNAANVGTPVRILAETRG